MKRERKVRKKMQDNKKSTEKERKEKRKKHIAELKERERYKGSGK